MQYTLEINGFSVNAQFEDSCVEHVLLPLVKRLAQMQRQACRRIVVLLAAPPGAGKSTLAAFLALLAENLPNTPRFQALGMDGFHFPNAYLQSHIVLRQGREVLLSQIKGAPESFDLPGLHRALALARQQGGTWPVYDRRIHDVSPRGVTVTGDVLLVEGNWLLLDAPGWRDLPRDYSLFIHAKEDLLQKRLIARKMRGGLTRTQAEAFYQACDGPNVRLCLAHHCPADLTLRMLGDGDFCI